MPISRIKTDGIQDDAVTSAKIGDTNVQTGDIATGAVTTAKLDTGAVTSAKLDTNIDIAGTLDVTGVLTADSNASVAGALTTTGDITASNSSGHRSLTVKGNELSNYQGGSILLANEAMGTNYGGTYLYHHKAGGGATSTNAAFNISQRTATGSYVSNIWNVDYDNTVQTFYLPNGALSGAAVMQMESTGGVTKPKQPYCALYRNADFNTASVAPVIYNATISDPYSMGDTTQGRITAPEDGHYLINAQLGYYLNGDARQTILTVRRNGANIRRSDGTVEDLQGNNGHSENSLSFVFYMNANDYIDVAFTSTATVTVHVPDFSCYLEIYKLG